MKRTVIAQICVAVLSIGLTVYCGYRLFCEYLQNDLYGLFGVSLVIWGTQIPLSGVFHELGHVLFGAMMKIKAKPHFTLFGSSSVDLIPLTDGSMKTRVLMTALGGCIVNSWFFLFGMVALAVPAVPTCLCMLAPPALYLGLFNILPLYTANGKTDGLIVREISRNEPEAQVLINVLRVQAQVTEGKPLSRIDKSLLFDVPVIREDDPAFLALMKLRRDFFEATGDTVGAEECDKRIDGIM